jgi:LysR family transcriptional regulator, nod-box dependent transcriptional activator
MSLRSVNLNLIPVLRALLREQNLSRAAESLGLTQPAVSGALTRLRAIFADPLLVRAGRGMSLTVRAHELIDPVERICVSLEDVIRTEHFEAAKCARRFVIAGADYSVLTGAPQLIRALQARAPNAMIHFVDIPHPMLEPHNGEVDFFIVPQAMFRNGNRPALRSTLLTQDELVTVVGADHRLANVKKPSQAQLLAESYVAYYPALIPLDFSLLSTVTGHSLQGRRVVAQVQQLTLLPVLAFETGCAALVPRRIAEYMARKLDVRIIHDGPLPIQFDLALAWYASSETDPAHRWFRELIIEKCTRLNRASKLRPER